MRNDDVTPNFKDNLGVCACGCGEGVYRVKPWRDGRHIRSCPCNRCRGSRNRRQGLTKQRKATKQLGLHHGQCAGSGEESLSGPVRTEVKATARHAKPIATAYQLMRAQSDAAKSIADCRPFVAAAVPPGSSLVYYVIRSDDLEAVVLALADVFGGAA